MGRVVGALLSVFFRVVTFSLVMNLLMLLCFITVRYVLRVHINCFPTHGRHGFLFLIEVNHNLLRLFWLNLDQGNKNNRRGCGAYQWGLLRSPNAIFLDYGALFPHLYYWLGFG
jgi:hypothetical protein